MFNEYTFLVFMALIAVLYFLLRLVYQKGTIRNKCPSCNVKLKRKVVQNGIDKFGLVLKPFKCPACHASIIFEKEPYDLFLGAMIFGCILAFIDLFMDIFSIEMYAFEKGSEITSTVVIAFMLLKKAVKSHQQ
jgi:hypothetical protein